jgi:cation diffusion facilitator family transporter
MSKVQVREHAGHSHSHGHSHDNTYLTSSNKNDAGVKITRIGLFVNLGMAIGKGFGGYVFHSQALIADGFHALTDLVSDFMTLATISWSLRPPTDRFPLGYGKIESLGALGVSGLLLFGGLGMGLNSLDTLYTQFFVSAVEHAHENGHGLFSFLGHGHSHGPAVPNLNAAWLAAGSIVVKEWLYRASKYFYRQERTKTLKRLQL